MIMRRTRDGLKDMDWDKLKVFHAAAEAGSFTHAGEQLGLSQSAVNDKAGARTPLAIVFASIAIGSCLLFLTGLLHNLPQVILAAIVLVAVRGLIDLAARNTDAPVLLVGETGTGKGFVARRIHDLSDRRAAPFVEEGDPVAPGQTLCILEAMKLMNEIKAETEGIVRKIHVQNAQPVEFGQLLFELEPIVAPPAL